MNSHKNPMLEYCRVSLKDGSTITQTLKSVEQELGRAELFSFSEVVVHDLLFAYKVLQRMDAVRRAGVSSESVMLDELIQKLTVGRGTRIEQATAASLLSLMRDRVAA